MCELTIKERFNLSFTHIITFKVNKLFHLLSITHKHTYNTNKQHITQIIFTTYNKLTI